MQAACDEAWRACEHAQQVIAMPFIDNYCFFLFLANASTKSPQTKKTFRIHCCTIMSTSKPNRKYILTLFFLVTLVMHVLSSFHIDQQKHSNKHAPPVVNKPNVTRFVLTPKEIEQKLEMNVDLLPEKLYGADFTFLLQTTKKYATSKTT